MQTDQAQSQSSVLKVPIIWCDSQQWGQVLHVLLGPGTDRRQGKDCLGWVLLEPDSKTGVQQNKGWIKEASLITGVTNPWKSPKAQGIGKPFIELEINY